MSVQYIGFQNTGECVVLAARKEGASSFPVRITYRLAPHISCSRESESRENSRFAIGDFTFRLLCGQHCCDIVRPLRSSAYLVFRFCTVTNRVMKYFDKLYSLLLFIHSPRQAQNPSLTLVAIKWA